MLDQRSSEALSDDEEVFGGLNQTQGVLADSEKKLKQQLKELDETRARAALKLNYL